MQCMGFIFYSIFLLWGYEWQPVRVSRMSRNNTTNFLKELLININKQKTIAKYWFTMILPYTFDRNCICDNPRTSPSTQLTPSPPLGPRPSSTSLCNFGEKGARTKLGEYLAREGVGRLQSTSRFLPIHYPKDERKWSGVGGSNS